MTPILQVKWPIDWQGHRGARGLSPENTIPSFLKALEYPQITTLELDVVLSADGKVVVSHEPWLNPRICKDPLGNRIPEEDGETYNLYRMPYRQVKQCDCGSLGNPGFPQQVPQFACKPLLGNVVNAVRRHCRQTGRKMPRFNVEIKANPAHDGLRTPPVEAFSEAVRREIHRLGIGDLTCIQSFDPRAIRYLKSREPSWTLAYLVEQAGNIDNQVQALGFKPAIYSPHFSGVTPQLVMDCHRLGMKIIPWTVNDTDRMRALVAMGVDGIITDYPDRIPE